jgi:hypothetical protein
LAKATTTASIVFSDLTRSMRFTAKLGEVVIGATLLMMLHQITIATNN